MAQRASKGDAQNALKRRRPAAGGKALPIPSGTQTGSQSHISGTTTRKTTRASHSRRVRAPATRAVTDLEAERHVRPFGSSAGGAIVCPAPKHLGDARELLGGRRDARRASATFNDRRRYLLLGAHYATSLYNLHVRSANSVAHKEQKGHGAGRGRPGRTEGPVWCGVVM